MEHPGIALMNSLLEAYCSVCKPISRESGLPQPALNILLFISDQYDGCTAGEFCRQYPVKPNLVSFHVERLVNEGYLERRPVPGDRRKVQLVCTEKAIPPVKALKTAIEKFNEDMLRGFSSEERTLLHSFLFRLIENTRQLSAAERKDPIC